jgi:hypothetical protein
MLATRFMESRTTEQTLRPMIERNNHDASCVDLQAKSYSLNQNLEKLLLTFIVDTNPKNCDTLNPMKDPITLLLRLFGYEYNNKPSLLKMHMADVTHESYFQKHMRHGTFNNFLVKKY